MIEKNAVRCLQWPRRKINAKQIFMKIISLFFLVSFHFWAPTLLASSQSGISIELSDSFPVSPLADLRRDVSGVSKSFAAGECQGDQITSSFEQTDSFISQVDLLSSYFRKCGQDISNPLSRTPVFPLIQFAAIRYVFSENQNLKMAKITLPEGRVVRGVLGLKPDRKPRPFILVKCGVFCDAKESANVVSALMHLFDESPFHVLVLGNITGAQFEGENSSFAVGGFDEGRQLFQIASFLKEESWFKERISTVQTLGVSLGGHAALFSALYSSQNPLSSGHRAIDASMAICPVVNLENSLQRLYSHDLLSYGYTLITFRTLMSFADKLPFLRQALAQIKKTNPQEFYELLTQSSLKYYQDWTQKQPWDFQPFAGLKIQTQEQLWGVNNFANFVHQVEIPTFVVFAANDDIVRFNDNAALIPRDNPLVQVLSVPQGGHCAFSVANGYERWSRLLQDYFISNDPAWKKQRRSVLVDLSSDLYGGGFLRRFRPPQFSEQVQAEWKVEFKSEYAVLTLKYFNSTFGTGENTCLGIVPTDADDTQEGLACMSYSKIKVPLKKILGALNERSPQSAFEAQRLTRVLNTRTTLVNKDFENYLHSENQKPFYLKIERFD